jgi:hypothetical protein
VGVVTLRTFVGQAADGGRGAMFPFKFVRWIILQIGHEVRQCHDMQRVSVPTKLIPDLVKNRPRKVAVPGPPALYAFSDPLHDHVVLRHARLPIQTAGQYAVYDSSRTLTTPSASNVRRRIPSKYGL